MTFAEVEQLLRDANQAAADYLQSKSPVDLLRWNLANWRLQHAAEMAEFRARAEARVGGVQ